MLEALKADSKRDERQSVDRLRLQMLLDSVPSIERMWFVNSKVSASGVSRKGDKFFAIGDDGSLKVWKTGEASEPVVMVQPGTARVAAWSPDGSRLAAVCADGLRIWNAATGECIKGPLNLPRDRRAAGPIQKWPFLGLAYASGGRLIFTVGPSGLGQVWNAETGQPIGKSIPNSRAVNIDFADSDRLLVLTFKDAMRVYETQTGTEKRSHLADKGDDFLSMIVSPDGRTIVGCHYSGRTVLLDAASGKPQNPFLQSDPLPIADSGPRSMKPAFSPDGKLFAIGTADGIVRVWTLADGRLLWRKQVKAQHIAQVVFSPDSTSIAVTRENRSISILAAQDGDMIAARIPCAAGSQTAFCLQSSQRIFTIDPSGLASLWNLTPRLAASVFPFDHFGKATVSLNRSGLAVTEENHRVWLLHASPGARFNPSQSQTFEVGDPDSRIDAVALSDEGSQVAVSTESQVFVFQTLNGQRRGSPLTHESNVTGIRFTPDSNRLICATQSGQVVVWDLDNSKQIYKPLEVGRSPFGATIDVDPEGKYFAVTGMKGVAICEVATGNRIASDLGGVFPRCAEFLSLPRRILIGTHRAEEIFDFTTGKSVGATPEHRALLVGLNLSADRSRFLAAYLDGTARLWSAENAAPASPQFDSDSQVVTAALDANAHFVSTATQDRRVQLSLVATGEIVSAFPLTPTFVQFGRRSLPTGRNIDLRLFFSDDGRTAYILCPQALLVSLDMYPDARSVEQLQADVAVRSRVEGDSAAGLRTLPTEELRRAWNVLRHHSGVSTAASAADILDRK